MFKINIQKSTKSHKYPPLCPTWAVDSKLLALHVADLKEWDLPKHHHLSLLHSSQYSPRISNKHKENIQLPEFFWSVLKFLKDNFNKANLHKNWIMWYEESNLISIWQHINRIVSYSQNCISEYKQHKWQNIYPKRPSRKTKQNKVVFCNNKGNIITSSKVSSPVVTNGFWDGR